MLKVFETLPAVFKALTLNVNEPVLVGVPLTTPVDELSDKPFGSEPLTLLKVIGLVPYAAIRAL